MSANDSSAAESSDDDLLASPVFKKRDRRTERAERTKLDFFDTCLRGGAARTDVHRRIASVENEFKRKLEVGEDAVNGTGSGGENGGSCGDFPDGESAPKIDGLRDGKNDSNIDNDSKENVQNNISGEPHLPPSNVKMKCEVSAADDEEAYWSKVNSFAEQCAHKTPGAAAAEVHSARQRLTDAVSGLADYASDLTDDEGGTWKDGVSGMTRDRMRSEAEAKSQGLSSGLGLRRMFRPVAAPVAASPAPDKKNESGLSRFKSRNEALTELKSIVVSLQRIHRASNAQSAKNLQRLIIDPLAKTINRPQDCIWDSLLIFLRKGLAVSRKRAVVLPEAFYRWMWKIAISSFQAGGHCAAECCRQVCRFLAKEADAASNEFQVEIPFKNLFMDDVVRCLEDEFGLWVKHGPLPLSNKDSNSKNNPAHVVDLGALKNLFIIWTALFRRNLIRIREAKELNSVICYGEDASRALAAFARVQLANENFNTCGGSLPSVVETSIALTKSAAYQIMNKLDEAHVEEWIKHTSCRIVDACSHLGAGDEDAADSDDADGHLPLALAVASIWSYELNSNFSMHIALMKLNIAERALHVCLDKVTDWTGKINERIDYLCRDWDKDNTADRSAIIERLRHTMHALVTAEVGFQWIDEESDSFTSDHPHFYAAALIAGECALTGACIFWRTKNDNAQPEQFIYMEEEIDTVCECMSNIEELCDCLKKECRAVIAYPHLRRTKEYLTRLSKKLGATKGRSKNKRQKRREQGSLDSYFSRPSISDPFRDSQDS